MKGSNGLEALATLCGGASKAIENGNNQQTEAPKQPNQNLEVKSGSSASGAQPQVAIQQFSSNSINMNNVPNKPETNTSQLQQQGQNFSQVNPQQVAALFNAGLPQQNLPNKINGSDSALTLQQMMYLNLLQQNQNSVSNLINQQSQTAPTPSPQFVDQNALAMVFAFQQQQQQAQAQQEAAASNQQQLHVAQLQQQQQQQQHDQQSQFRSIIPPPSQSSSVPKDTNAKSNAFPTPRPKSTSGAAVAGPACIPSMTTLAAPPPPSPVVGDNIKPNPASVRLDDVVRDRSNSGVFSSDDKKLLKRAANRRSAQLSRKRKKQYIEELKDENADLRRMELILRSIPDMIVSFDSSGKIGFVSQSVCQFLAFKPEELEGTSFWERLCDDSVRLLKAAFMDALAARESDSTTTPLGDGVWELRLQDKNKEVVKVSLNGVVHFTGDAPECVCSIRLCEGKQFNTTILREDPNTITDISTATSQSVFSGESQGEKRLSSEMTGANQAIDARKNPRISASISDVDSSSNGEN